MNATNLGSALTSSRFASVVARCADEAEMVKRVVSLQTLRSICFVPAANGSLRPATDDELRDPQLFSREKDQALLAGTIAANAHAKRLIRRYGLRDKYVPQ